MPEDAIRGSVDKDYEEYIADLETELSEAKGEIKRLESDLANERDTAGYWVSLYETQDAITAWSMGFE